MSDLVGNPKDRFCSDAAHIMTRILEIRIIETGGLTGVKNNRVDELYRPLSRILTSNINKKRYDTKCHIN